RYSVFAISRLLAVFCVSHAVATVAEPPTSDPSTPDIAPIRFGSIAPPWALRRGSEGSGGRLLAFQVREALLEPVEDIVLAPRCRRLSKDVDRLLAYREVHHQQGAQLGESDGIV